MGIREGSIERYLTKQVKDIDGLCYKWVCPGHVGVPDRIVLHKGSVYFIEVKTKSGRQTIKQINIMNNIIDQQHAIYIISSKDEVDDFIRSVIFKIENANAV